MKRLIDAYLLTWKDGALRMPLLIRGARQVGKTYAVAQLGKSFDDFVEINFERSSKFKLIFEKDLDPARIIRELGVQLKRSIIPGKTLLFLDEVQESENAFRSLRYFYEEMPELHVIAAGSLLDFHIEKIGMPVGRIESLYMYPLSFIEFLYAVGHELLAQEIIDHDPRKPMSESLHELGMAVLGEYLAVGGMPAAVKWWRDTKNLHDCGRILGAISKTYKQDFDKYAKRSQIKYLELLFNHIPKHLSEKFKYSSVSQDYTKRELEPCLDMLSKAGIVTKILMSAGQGIPLGAQASYEHFKVIFLDVALSQNVMGLNVGAWITNPLTQFVNKGGIVEAFIGQELLAYAGPFAERNLYYWHREERTSNAEIDYLIQQEEQIIPIEIKSGHGGKLQSMRLFLDTHPNSPYGIRFAPHNYSFIEKIHNYPLYAVARLFNLS